VLADQNKRKGSCEGSMGCSSVVVMNLSSGLAGCVTFLQTAWCRCLWVTGAVRELEVSSPRTSPGAVLPSTFDWLPQLVMGQHQSTREAFGPVLTLLEVQLIVWSALGLRGCRW
jgi:hypothetical protein